MNLSRYRKTITATITGLLGWAGVVITSSGAHISASEWLALATVLATAFGVFIVRNDPMPTSLTSSDDITPLLGE